MLTSVNQLLIYQWSGIFKFDVREIVLICR